MKKNALILLTFLAAVQLEALLPPLYQTSDEIQSILSDHQLGQKLDSGEPIKTIERKDQNYFITTNKSLLKVHVTYLPAERPGPIHYHLHFDDPIPLQEESSGM